MQGRVEPVGVRRPLLVLIVGLALLPLLVSAVQLAVDVGDEWAPTGDRAMIELRVRDIGRHPVFLGLYSRDGWSHPGPAGAAVLFLPYRLSGSLSIGLAFGALLVNGAAIAGMALVAARRGGLPILLATVVATTVVMRALGPEYLRDPWNCSVTVLPFGLLLFLVWTMTSGDAWALPVGTVVATYLAQTHVQYVALAYPLLAVGAGALAWRALRADAFRASSVRRSVGRAAAISIPLLAVLWLPPVIEQLGNGKGNLTRIAEWFSTADEGTHTVREGLRIVLGQFGLPPEWIAGHAPNNPFNGEPSLLLSAPPPVLLVPVLVAVVLLWRRRCDDGLRLCGVVAVALVIGVLAVARTIGIVYDYRLQWTWVLPMAAAVAVAWAGWALASRSARGARSFVGIGAAAVLVLTAVNTLDATAADSPEEPSTPGMAELVPQVLQGLPDGDGDVVLRFSGPPGSVLYGLGILLQLERHGVNGKVARDPAHLVGDSRVHRRGSPVLATLTITTENAFDELIEDGQEARLIAYFGDRPPEERLRINRETAAARRRIDDARRRGELADRRALEAEAELPMPGRAVGVFVDLP